MESERSHRGKIASGNRGQNDYGVPLTLLYLGTIYVLQDKENEAVEAYLRAYELDQGVTEKASSVREYLANIGRAAAFAKWKAELEDAYRKGYFPPSNITLVASLQRGREGTLHWLSESEQVKDPWILQILHDPEYDFLKGNPRYDALIARLLSR